jgi:endonuclease-8
MPEGPEIWRSADKLNDALAGNEIKDCFFYHEELKSYERQLVGQTVKRVEPRAKALITYFDSDLCLYTHNQLYGKWMVAKAGSKPNTSRSLRVALHTNEYSALLYSASEIDVLSKHTLKDHSYLQKLGPDVVHPDTTVAMLLQQYEDDAFQNRKLATLLLDQSFLSGVGNYLRSEILFYANVNPLIKLRECTQEQKQRLAKASILLSRRSYETGGITNDPEIVEALKREKAKRKNYRHFVYGRTGKYCHKCGTQIEEDKTGGRKVYFCPSCQRLN